MADENNGQNRLEDFKPEEEMTEEERTALQADEDFIANFSDEDKKDPEKVTQLNEAILRSAQTTIHQKRHYRDLAKGDKGKQGNEQTPPANTATPPAKKEEPAEEKIDKTAMIELRQDHPELTKAQAEMVMKHAAAYKITPEEAYSQPLMQQAIKNAQTKEDVEDASHGSSRSAAAGAENRDWSNASQADIEAQRRRILSGGQ